jgi:hypothetical protein
MLIGLQHNKKGVLHMASQAQLDMLTKIKKQTGFIAA